jgi:transglutaminase-like putative cysteine protease
MAQHGLARRALRSAARAGRVWKLTALLMLVVLLSAAAASVAAALKQPTWVSLWPSVVFGLFAGWALAASRQPGWRAVLALAIIESIYLLLVPAGLLSAAYGIAEELGHVLLQIGVLADGGHVDVSTLGSMVRDFSAAMGVIVGRAEAWVAALIGGDPLFDPLVAALAWNAVIWSTSAWAGWAAEARESALLAATPALLLGVAMLSYADRISSALHVMLGATLLVLATIQHGRRQRVWDETGVAYPAEKGRQILGAALWWTVVLVLISSALSAVSIQRVQEWISDLRKPAAEQEDDLAESLGVVARGTPIVDAFGPARAPGLPRVHLIGSGPELSRRVVMTVSVSGLPPPSPDSQPPPLYWRSFTYDVYSGYDWSSSQAKRTRYGSNQRITSQGTGRHQLVVRQQVFPAEDLGGVLYAAGEPVAVGVPSEAAWRAPEDLFGVQLDATTGYEALSAVPLADERTLRSAGQRYPDWIRERFLTLPARLPGRVSALAAQLTASESAPYDRARAIEAHLRAYPYTLDVPRPSVNEDLVDFFLFDLREGYCDYYASAMVVLSRAAGVPARLAVGYASGVYNLNSKRFVVSQADAHTWVEVYFPGIGWVPFEPTASRPRFDRALEALAETHNAPLPAEPAESEKGGSSPWQTILLASFVLVGTSLAAGAALDEARLRKLPQRAAATEIYNRLRRMARHLRATGTRGDTPYEFAGSLGGRLREIARTGGRDAFGSQVSRDVDKIADAIVDINYRPSPPRAPHVSSLWYRLRWRLRLAWIMQGWHSTLARIKRFPG